MDGWSKLQKEFAVLKAKLAKCKAINVNTATIKDSAKTLTQIYFRESRPELRSTGLGAPDLETLDRVFQSLLKLANGNNPVRRYKTEMAALSKLLNAIEAEREKRISESSIATPQRLHATAQDAAILSTLEAMAPGAALSFKQACLDLADKGRVSFRGTANELRESVREVLDQLAPDATVKAQSGFRFEEGQRKPTMKQKVRFILRARGVTASAAEVPENTVALVEETVGKLTRATYNRSSLSAHVGTARGEVVQLKMYVDSVLAELLEIHRDS